MRVLRYVYIVALCCVAARADEPTPLSKSLELDHWDESRFAVFEDHVPLSVDERLEVERLVERLGGFDRRVFYGTPPAEVDFEQLLSAPDEYRGKLVRVDGSMTILIPPTNNHSGVDNPQPTFTCLIRNESGEGMVVAGEASKRWANAEVTGQPIAAYGLFIKLVRTDEGKQLPLIAAPRVEWYPEESNPPMVNYGMSVLGIMGVDVALLDRAQQRGPLTRDETIAFYKLLAGMQSTTGKDLIHWAARHLPRHRESWQQAVLSNDTTQQALASEVLRVAKDGQYSVAPFFNLPASQVGELAVFDGVVRRAIRVEVAGDLDAAAVGIDHYYELAVFTDDSQNNPLMFAVLDVPPELPLGDNVRAPVRVAGFFFKSWRYGSRQSDNTGGEQLRVAPLFIGHSPLVIVAPPPDQTWGWIVGLGFVGVVALVWLAGWRRSSRDRAFAAGTLARIKRPIDPVDLDPDRLPNDSV